MTTNTSAISRANSALVIAFHGDTLLFVGATGNDGARLGFGLPQGLANVGEDIVTCARRIILEQLGVAAPSSAVRYIGSIALEAGDQLHWQPVVLAHLPEAVRPEGKALTTVPLNSLDALLASGGVAQAASLAALAFYHAKKQVGHLA